MRREGRELKVDKRRHEKVKEERQKVTGGMGRLWCKRTRGVVE